METKHQAVCEFCGWTGAYHIEIHEAEEEGLQHANEEGEEHVVHVESVQWGDGAGESGES